MATAKHGKKKQQNVALNNVKDYTLCFEILQKLKKQKKFWSKNYCDKVKPFFDQIRSHVDTLEGMIDDNLWAMPKYREMLFIR
jgi:glutamine synthetase type III